MFYCDFKEVTTGIIRLHPAASLASGFCMQNKIIIVQALGQATGGPMGTTLA